MQRNSFKEGDGGLDSQPPADKAASAAVSEQEGGHPSTCLNAVLDNSAEEGALRAFPIACPMVLVRQASRPGRAAASEARAAEYLCVGFLEGKSEQRGLFGGKRRSQQVPSQ